jgi:hypothetical protein
LVGHNRRRYNAGSAVCKESADWLRRSTSGVNRSGLVCTNTQLIARVCERSKRLPAIPSGDQPAVAIGPVRGHACQHLLQPASPQCIHPAHRLLGSHSTCWLIECGHVSQSVGRGKVLLTCAVSTRPVFRSCQMRASWAGRRRGLTVNRGKRCGSAAGQWSASMATIARPPLAVWGSGVRIPSAPPNAPLCEPDRP